MAEGGGYIPILRKLKGEPLGPAAFYLLAGAARGPVVADGGGLHDDVGLIRDLHTGLIHVVRADGLHDLYAGGPRKRGRAGYQGDFRAALPGGARDRVAHLAAAGVAYVAHRVDVLVRRSGRHRQAEAGKVLLGAEHHLHIIVYRFARGKASFALVAAGQHSAVRVDDDCPALRQGPHVAPRRLIGKHLAVHRGKEQQRFIIGQQRRAEQRRAVALRRHPQHAARAGRDHEEIRPVCERYMGNPPPMLGRHEVALAPHAALAERRKHHRTYKGLRRLRKDRLHLTAHLHPAMQQVGRLVGGDAAAYSEKYLFMPQAHLLSSGEDRLSCRRSCPPSHR